MIFGAAAGVDRRMPLDADTLRELRNEFDIIPLVRRLSADTITPVAAFDAVSSLASESFLLESVERGESLGRYSFIGFEPRRTLLLDNSVENPIEVLREEFCPLSVWNESELPPFFGGAVAWFGYGAARWSERLPDRHANDLDLPDGKVLFFDNVIVFDHLKQQLWIIASLFSGDPRGEDELLVEAAKRLHRAEEALRSAKHDLVERTESPAEPDWTSNCTRDQYIESVRLAKEQIVAGEAFQIVLSQRWETPFPTSASLDLYRSLRSINPSPYMFLLRTGECTLVGSSPEMLVRIQGGKIDTRPIAGTRPRGLSRRDDHLLERELLEDPKENAEHLMLVDLSRNDLGRVSERGSVEVDEFLRVERYSHVMHLVSNVTGTLRNDRTPIEAFFSAFPAGTVSGAPKIRAMELIDELESTRRGPYAGSIAYVGFSGNLDSCISIRTFVLKNDRAYVQAGAGIVFDSDPAKEHEECLNKAAGLKRAVGVARASARGRIS